MDDIVEFHLELHIRRRKSKNGINGNGDERIVTPKHLTGAGKPFTEEQLRDEIPRLTEELVRECFK
jgi:hypothetical protein